MIPASFRRVLAAPGAPRLIAGASLGRVPITFTALASVLLVREHTGSFASAGLVAAAEAAGAGLATPIQGRLIDRLGQPRVLVPCAVGNAAALIALVVAAGAGAATGVLLVCAFVAGCFLPPLGACMRALWPVLLGERGGLDAAYSLEAILTEVLFISGPVVATVLFALASPAAALVVAAGLALGGTLLYAGSHAARAWHGRPHEVAAAWALASSGMRVVVTANVCIGVAFGSIEVAMAAFARAHGTASAAGLPLAAMAAGSMAGGLWYGTREWRTPLARRLVGGLAVLALALAPLVLAGSIPVIVVLSVLSGVPIAPTAACAYSLVEDVTEAGALAEAFTWLSTSNVVGAAAGSAITGPVVQAAGVRAGLAVPAAAVAVAAVVAGAGRGALRPREAMVGRA